MEGNYRNPGVAAVLSVFLMGLGQIYNGRIGEGLLWMGSGGILVGTCLTLFYAGQIRSALGLAILAPFLLLVLWVCQIYRAYNSALHVPQAGVHGTNDQPKSRKPGAWVCSECGTRLRYEQEVCPKCRATSRRWAE